MPVDLISLVFLNDLYVTRVSEFLAKNRLKNKNRVITLPFRKMLTNFFHLQNFFQFFHPLSIKPEPTRMQQPPRFTTVPESCLFGTTERSPSLQQQLSPYSNTSPTSSSTSTTHQQPLLGHFRFPHLGSLDQSSVARPLRGQKSGRDVAMLEDPNELETFMQQGEDYCINEMKKFITQYSLRQTTVAQMTGGFL
jgi:hypothetical protein